ncbi:MAG: carboxypeptidase-like regulatory domain-containing protein [Bacteroidota bacterium]
MNITKTLLLLSIISFSNILSQTSLISGKIEDATNGETLIGVNIIVNEIDGLGTATDIDGKFKLQIEPGSYSLKISYIGYNSIVKTDVVVLAGKETFLNIKLTPSAIQIDETVVRADYFDKSLQTNNLATVMLSPEEIRRSPGSIQDFQRILQGIAGVSFSDDKNNELLVRGGSPNENLTVIDEMELHSTNHFPNEFNSGGPINMINVDLIENIQFSTGGFISKYGDKLSSVMQITTREGTRSSYFSGNANLSIAGFGGIFEGKINDGKGSWVISARKSYINLISGAVGLTAVPYYYDFQFKVAYDLSSKHKLSWSGIYGNDKILIEGESDQQDLTKIGVTDSVGIERVDVKLYQYATGVTLKSIWEKNLYSMTTLYYNNYFKNVTVDENFTERVYDNEGKLASNSIINKRNLYDDTHHNSTMALKSEWYWNLDNTNELNLGGSVATGDFIQTLYLTGNEARYFINGQWSPVIIVPESNLEYNIKLFDNYKYYAFINDKIKLFNNRLILNAGLRYDYFSYSNKGNVSPRFSGSYFIIPGQTSFNFAYGEYYQTQSYPTYGDREKSGINRYLKNSHSRHLIAGIEHVIDDGLKVNLEAYHKSYDDIPVSEEFIHFTDRTFRSNRNINIGTQTINGIDLLIQQKLVKDYFGTISYSRMWTKYNDPRIGYEGRTLVSEYDFPHVFNLVVGKRFQGMRTELDKSFFLIKYLSYILPFSDDMEISFRWRYASGQPYTERYWTESEQYYEGETRWSKGNWRPVDQINNARFPDYHRLDIAFNSRFNFDNWSIAIFLSIQNLYNRKNIAGYQYNSDGTVTTVYQFAFLPVVGIDVRF